MNANLVPQPCYPHNSKTDWDLFKNLVSESVIPHVSLKSDEDIEEHFNHCIQNPAWESTPINIPKNGSLSSSKHQDAKLFRKS